MKPTALYRHFARTGELLYVGIAGNPMARLHDHGKQSVWARAISMVTIVWYPDRFSAEEAERFACMSEGPKYNIQGSPRADRSLRPPVEPKPPKPKKLPLEWFDSPAETAAHFGISEYKLRQLMKKGMPYQRMDKQTIRFVIKDIQAWGKANAEREVEKTRQQRAIASAIQQNEMRAAMERVFGRTMSP